MKLKDIIDESAYDQIKRGQTRAAELMGSGVMEILDAMVDENTPTAKLRQMAFEAKTSFKSYNDAVMRMMGRM